MAALPKVARYIKNVGKSIVYASVDNIKEDMPNIAAVVDHESNKEVYKAIYQGVRDYRTTYSRAVKFIKSTKLYEAGGIAVTAVKEDIKSGKLYNVDRMAEIEDKVAAQMGFGMDDLEDFGIDDSDAAFSSEDDITEGDRMTAGATMVASMKNAEMVSNTIIRSTEAQMRHTEASTNLLYTQNFKLFGELRSDITNIGTRGIQEQGKTNSILTTMADNQRTFYENATKSLQEIAAYMKESTEMSRNLYGQKQQDSEKQNNKITISDLIDSNGVLDLKEYGKLIARNTKNVVSEKTGGALDMLNMGGGDANMLAMFAANPLGELLKGGLRGAMSKSLRSAMKDLDKTIGGVAATAIARFTNIGKNDEWDANPLFKTIGQILGVNTSVKSSIDPGKFEKGPVPFDGITRATINHGITGYLSRIEAALTGEPVRVYNPQTGKWTTAKGIKKEFDSMKKGAVSSGTSDVADEMAQLIYNKHWKPANRTDKKKIEDNFNNFMQALYEKNGDFKLNSWGDYMDWGVDSEDMFKMMVGALKQVKSGTRFGTAGSVMDAKASLNRRMEELEKNGSIYSLLFSGAFDAKDLKYDQKYEAEPTTGLPVNVATYKDTKGHDMYFYLRNILDEVYRMRNAVGGVGGGYNQLRYGNGKQFKQLDSLTKGDKPSKPTNKQKYLSSEASANTRYNEEIEKFVQEGGNLYDLYDGDKLKAIMENLSEEERIKVKQRMMNSENAFQRAIYRRHFTQEDLNKKREEQNKDPLVGGVVERFKQATLTEKLQMGVNALNTAAAKPSEVAEDLIRKADARIYEFFYGAKTGEKDENGRDIKGFMQLMSNRMNAQINKATDFLEEKVFGKIKEKLGIKEWGDLVDKLGIKKFFKDAKEGIFGTKDSEGKRSGGIFGDYIQGVKDTLKQADENATNWIKNAFMDVTAPIRDKFKSGPKEIELTDYDNTSATVSNNVLNLDLASKYKGAILEANRASVTKFEAYKKAIGNNTILGDEDAKMASMIAKFNYNLLKVVKQIVNSFKAFPMMLEDMQYGKYSYLFDPVNLGAINPETGFKFLESLVKFFSQARAINYLSDEEYKKNYRLQTLSTHNKINNFNSIKDKALMSIKNFVKNNSNVIQYSNDLEIVLQAAIDKHQQEIEAAAGDTGYNPELYDRLQKYKKDKSEGTVKPELEAKRSTLMNKYAGNTNIVTNSKFDPNNSAFAMREQSDDEKAIEECNKIAAKLIKVYNLNEKTARDMQVLILALHDSGKDINELLASELCDSATNLGYTDLAIKINRTMTEDYMNRDFTLKDIKVDNKANRPSVASSIFDRSTEILQKIYSLLSSVFTPYERTDIDNTVAPIIRPRTIVGANGLPIISRGRESETEGDSTGSEEPPSAAFGAYFAKAGTSALSKDEIYGRNGLYGKVPQTGVYNVKAGTTIYPTNKNKAIELANEQNAIDKFIKSNAEGDNTETREFNGKAYFKEKIDGVYRWVRREGAKTFILEDSPGQKAKNSLIEMASSGAGQVKAAWNGVSYTGVKIDNKNAKQLATEIRKAAPEITVGTALGAAAGLLIGNPLLGAALGGAMSITSVSETAKTWLFGEQIKDSDGNVTGRKGGAIPKSVQDAFAKYAPEVSKHAFVGGALGLVTPFGLVGGALLGAAAGYVKTNEDARLMLFGDTTDPNSGIISKNARDKLAKIAPNLATGAIAGILTGPFGLVGNAVLGSGLGFLTTTETFKTAVLGEPLKIGPNGEEVRVGGLVGVIRDDIVEPIKDWGMNFVTSTQEFLSEKVFKPLADSFQPIVHEIARVGKGFGKFLEGAVDAALNNQFTKSIGSWLHGFLRPVKGAASIASNVAGTVAKGTILAPVTAISALGNHLRSRQIARGDANYMTAQERLDYRANTKSGKLRNDKALEMDKTLVSLDSEGLDVAADTVKALSVSKGFYQKSLNQKSRAISTLLGAYFDGWTLHKMRSLCKKNQWQSVLNLINTATPKDITKFDTDTKKALMEKVSTLMAEYDAAKKAKSMTEADRGRAFDKLRELGFTNITESNLETLYGSITQQKDLTKAQEATKTEEEKTRDNDDKNTNKIVEELRGIREALLTKDYSKELNGKTYVRTVDKDNKSIWMERSKYLQSKGIDVPDISTDTNTYERKGKIYTRTIDANGNAKWVSKDKNAEDISNMRGVDTFKGTLRDKSKDDSYREYYDSDSNKIRTFRKTLTGWKEIQSKSSTDANRNEDKEQEKQAGFIANAISKLPGFGKKEKEDNKEKKKESIFSKILKGAGKALSFMSPVLKISGGGLALVTGAAAAGHLGNFMETKGIPYIKAAWNEKVQPWLQEHFGNKFDAIIEHIRNIPTYIQNAITGAFNWLNTNKDKVLTWYTDGLKYLGGYVQKGLSFVVSNLPTILWTFGKNIVIPGIKGVFEGVASWFKPKETKSYKDRVSPKATTINFSDANKVITEANSAGSRLGITSSIDTTKDISLDVESISGGDSGLVTKDQANTYKDLQTRYNNAKTDAERAAILQEAHNNAYVGKVITDDGNIIDYRDNTIMIKDKNGNTIDVDENGNIINNNDQKGKYNFNNTLKNRIGRAILTGNKGAIGLGLSATSTVLTKGGSALAATGKAISKVPLVGGVGKVSKFIGGVSKKVGQGIGVANKAWDAMPTVTNIAGGLSNTRATAAKAGGLAEKVITRLHDVIQGVLSNKYVSSILNSAFKLLGSETTAASLSEGFMSKVVEVIDTIKGKLTAVATNSGVTGFASKAATILNKVAIAVQIATAIKDFVTGYDNAEGILGVIEEETGYNISIAQKIACGLIKMINGFLLGLIDESTIADVIIDKVLPFFKIDTSELDKARQESEEFIAQLNATTGSDYDVYSYTTKDKWTTKLGNATKGLGGKVKDVASGAWNTVKDISSNIGKTVNNISDWYNNTALGKLDAEYTDNFKLTIDAMKEGNLAKMILSGNTYKDEEGNIDISRLVTNIANIPTKFAMIVPTAIIGSVRGVLKHIGPVMEGIKTEAGQALDTFKSIGSSVISGDIKGVFSSIANIKTDDDSISPGKLIASAIGGISLSMTAPLTLSIGAIKKASEFIKPVVEGIKTEANEFSTKFKTREQYVKNGDFKGLFSTLTDVRTESGDLSFGKILNSVTTVITLPQLSVMTAGNAVMNLFKENKTEPISIKDMLSQAWEYTNTSKHPTMDGYDKIGKSETGYSDITSITNALVGRIVTYVARPVISVMRGLSTFSDFVGGIKEKLGFNESTNKDNTTTYGTGRAYQRDPRIANIPFNRSGDKSRQTIGDSGCGPAAAVNAVNYAYGTGNDIITAANAARDYKELNGGTRPEFFNKYFKDNGLKANRLSGSSIEDNLKNGNPVVLMGKDSKGGLGTPYGPNPHYITAKGIDKNGNIIVDDPENPVGTAIYNKNRVLGHSSIAIGASKYGRSKWGMARDHIGYYVAEFESGNAGSSMISSGSGDYGGVSFGTYQFPSYKKAITTEGSLPSFWNKYYASSYPGVRPGDNEPFKNAWRSAVAANPDQFLNNELSFMYGQYYTPARNSLMSSIGLDPDKQSRGFQELVWAMAVQFGPSSAAKKIASVIGSNWRSMNQDTMIKTVSNYIANNVGTFFKSSSAKVQQSIANRYNNRQLNKLLPLASQNALDSTNVTSGGTVSNTITFANNTTTTSDYNSTSSNSQMSQLGAEISKRFKQALAAEYGDTAYGAIFGSGSGNYSKYGKGLFDYKITAIYSKVSKKKHNVTASIPKNLVIPHTNSVDPKVRTENYTVEGNFGLFNNSNMGYISADTAKNYGILPVEDKPKTNMEDFKKLEYEDIATGIATIGEKNTAGFMALGWINKPFEQMIMKGDASSSAINAIAKKTGKSVPISDGKKTVKVVYKQYYGINMDPLKVFADKIAPYADSSLEELQNKDSALYSQLKTYAKAVNLDISTRKNFEGLNVQQVCAKLGLTIEGGKVENATYATEASTLSDVQSTYNNVNNGGIQTEASSNNTGSIFDMIKSAFFSAFDYTDKNTGEKKNLLSVFGLMGSSSSNNSNTGTDSSGYCAAYGGTAPAGLSTSQSKVYQNITSIIGKNQYTQSSSRDQVGATLTGAATGYGDCSSTVRWALRTGAGVDPGSYTGAQITNDAGKWVDGPYEVGSNIAPNANALAVGDLMFYGKPTSSNPRHVSHVEMYYGNNKRIGHGSGIGPIISDYTAKSSNQTYLGAKRFIQVGGNNTIPGSKDNTTTGMGSANVSKGYIVSPFDDPTRESHNGIDIAASKGEPIISNINGEVIRSEYNETNGNMVVVRDGNGRLHTFEHMLSAGPKVGTRISSGSIIGYIGSTGRSSGNHVHVSVTDKNGQFVDPVTNKPSVNKRPIGGDSGIDYTTLIKAIIEILGTIADNTAKVDQLIALLAGNISPTQTQSVTPSTPSNNNTSIDSLNKLLSAAGYKSTIRSNNTSTIMETMSRIALE